MMPMDPNRTNSMMPMDPNRTNRTMPMDPNHSGSPMPGEPNLAHIRMVVTDLDGTLLASDKSVSPENLAAIARLHEQGVLFSFASGRMSQILAAYVRQLGVTAPVIACNGAKIFDPADGRVLHHIFLDPDEAEALLNFAWRHDLDCLGFGMDSVHYVAGSKRVQHYRNYNRIAARTGVPPVALIPFGRDRAGEHRALAQAGLLKILVAERSGGDIALALQHLSGSSRIYPEVSEPAIIDVLPMAANKGAALETIARDLGLALADVCVFGDYENDLSMMRKAGFSFAMANAVDSVKQAASALTGSNDEHGFATAVERLILPGRARRQPADGSPAIQPTFGMD